jgi:acyl-CoA thioesterase I
VDASPLPSRILAILRQVCRAVGACFVVIASLLVVPNAIPWLAAAWLLAFSLLVMRGRRGLVCLGACMAILVAKRPTPAPGLLALLAVMLLVLVIGVLRVWRVGAAVQLPSQQTSRRFGWLSVAILWIAWAAMTFDWFAAAHCRHPVALNGDRPVVCLGDSMTSLGMFGGYWQDLRKLISLPVVDMGISGRSAAQVAETYLPLLAQHEPQVVVIELGAHDSLRYHGRAATKANLIAIIDASRRLGAEVVLMEIPRAYMSDPYWGLEREIARQEDVELIPDTALRTILLHSPILPPGSWLGEPYLTDESGIHPNAAGNRLLAEHVAAALERMYGSAILRQPPATLQRAQ